jgi:UDP-N-acetylglucosamine--N-acetylmuramyl-(pentapeptide) pyrophosphoryl-undecaprenol N-acetylglucosamine transferase
VSARVLIAGGGTGGHVFPMVAVGEALLAERPGTEVTYVGTGRGIEARVVPEAGGTLERLDVLPLRGRGLGGFVRGAWRAVMVMRDARALVKRLDPDVVFSVGGYAAGPVTLAARTAGVPVTLMEPNAVLGFTNRLLSRLVQRAYVCFPETRSGFAPDVVRWTGVPLRSHFAPSPFAPQPGTTRILVMGGSQGAVALNEALPRAFARLVGEGLPIEVVHQTGKGKDAAVRSLYAELGVGEAVVITTFIDDVAAALGDADLVVERAGAGSLAELCAVGRPGLLIPYPHAADDHQRMNARSLVNDGAAICLAQSDATEERLTAELRALVTDPERLAAMAARAASRGRPDAARSVARDLLALGDARRGRAVTLDVDARDRERDDGGVQRRLVAADMRRQEATP